MATKKSKTSKKSKNKTFSLRDYLRRFGTAINEKAGIVFNTSKLHSTEEVETYILNLVSDIKNELDLVKSENIDLKKSKNNENSLSFVESQEKEKEIKGLKKEIKNLFKENEELRELLIKRMDELEKTEKELNTKEIELIAIKSKLEELRALRNLTISMTSLISVLATLMVVTLFR